MTSPELESTLNAPLQVCDTMLYVTVLVVPSASLDEAVMLADVPAVASSGISLSSSLSSTGWVTSNSS